MPCICCGGTSAVPFLQGLLRCSQCSHVWADAQIGDDELRTIYSRNYFEGGEYLDYASERPALEANFRARARELARLHPKGSRLWEIGSAYGFFLAQAAAHFDVAGCDISEHAARFARETMGVNVIAADYRRLPPPAAPFDAVCMWDVVEHLREPHLYLEKAAAELAPGGTLALSTGDIGSLMARWRGSKWRQIHPPSHLHYFTSRSISVLLQRLGLSIVSIRYPAFWRTVDATAFRVLAYPPGRATEPLYRALRATGLTRLSFPLNTWDLMTVMATKAA